MDTVQILFENISSEKKEILIAMLADAGFEGFEEEENILKAFTKSENFDEEKFKRVIGPDVTFSKSLIKETNWNEKWESDFQPVKIFHPITNAPFGYIRAGFHLPDESFLHDIIITPKMSFGTGHHPTTYLMVSQMSDIDFTNKSVIDFGTGTGVLAILAEKMGAASVIAIDCDDWSINNAKENIAINACSKVTIIKGESLSDQYKADFILANINLNVIIANLDNIKSTCNEGAGLLFSGLMVHDEERILNEIKLAGFASTKVFRRDNWIALHVDNL